jgi:hypothetical protein
VPEAKQFNRRLLRGIHGGEQKCGAICCAAGAIICGRSVGRLGPGQ